MEMMVPWFDGGTYIIDRRSHEEKGALQQNYVDSLCMSYLGKLIENLNLVPFQSEGDGNCLLHAVCKAVSGKDSQFAQLREQMTQELIENEPWYRFHLHLDDSEWNKSLEMSQGDGNYLGFEHIFALSNVLRRPILLLDNLTQVSAFGEGDVRSFSPIFSFFISNHIFFILYIHHSITIQVQTAFSSALVNSHLSIITFV